MPASTVLPSNTFPTLGRGKTHKIVRKPRNMTEKDKAIVKELFVSLEELYTGTPGHPAHIQELYTDTPGHPAHIQELYTGTPGHPAHIQELYTGTPGYPAHIQELYTGAPGYPAHILNTHYYVKTYYKDINYCISYNTVNIKCTI